MKDLPPSILFITFAHFSSFHLDQLIHEHFQFQLEQRRRRKRTPFHGGAKTKAIDHIYNARGSVIWLSTRIGQARPNRGGRKKEKEGEKGANWSKERKREKRKKDDGAMGPPPKLSLPHEFFPASSRLDETRSSHVTLNWSIIWQSSCPNRRHSQSTREYPCQIIAKVSSSIGGAIFQKYSVLFPIESIENVDYIYRKLLK